MNGRCETDPLDRAINVCGSCYGEYCEACLVMLKGRRHPVCTRCARVLSGIRPGYSIERKGPKNSAKKRREALLSATAEDESAFAYFEPESAAATEEEDVPRSRLHRLGRRSSKHKNEESHSESVDDAANAPPPRKRVMAEQPIPAVDQLAQLRKEQAASADDADVLPQVASQPTDETPSRETPRLETPALEETDGLGDAPSSVVEQVAEEVAEDVTEPLGKDPSSPVSISDLIGRTRPEADATEPAPDPEIVQKLTGITTQTDSSTPEGPKPETTDSDGPGPEVADTVDSADSQPEAGESGVSRPETAEPKTTAPQIAALADEDGQPALASRATSEPDQSTESASSTEVDDQAAEQTDADEEASAKPKRTYPERRKGEQLQKQLGKPKTAPMIGEIQTIGGRRSTDAIQAETVVAPEQVPAATAETEAGGVDSFDAEHAAAPGPVATIVAPEKEPAKKEPAKTGADSQNVKRDVDVKHDVDAKGNWVPPILRGMAVDARKAAADLPKRRSS